MLHSTAHVSISWLLSVQWVLQRVALGKRKMSRKSACARLSGELPSYRDSVPVGRDRILPGEGYFRYRRIILEGQKTYRQQDTTARGKIILLGARYFARSKIPPQGARHFSQERSKILLQGARYFCQGQDTSARSKILLLEARCFCQEQDTCSRGRVLQGGQVITKPRNYVVITRFRNYA